MAGTKETPRQKMIGMMYLVLTALLALQVSNAVLEKFAIINETMDMLIKDGNAGNQQTLSQIVEDAGQNPDPKVQKAVKDSKELREITLETLKYIDELKERMIKAAESTEIDDKLINDHSSNVATMMIDKGSKEQEGVKFVKVLDEYIKKVNDLAGLSGKDAMDKLTKGPDEMELFKGNEKHANKDYLTFTFENTPPIAAIASVTQLQTEILDIESKAMEILGAKAGAKIVKVDKIVPMVRPRSSTVAAGATYEADMFITASSSAYEPKFYLGDKAIESFVDPKTGVKMGKVQFRAEGGGYDSKTGLATKSFKARIELNDQEYAEEMEYFVAKPVIRVTTGNAPTLYMNCGNTVNIEVPALGTDYKPTFSAGSSARIIQSGSPKVVIVPKQRKVTVSVSNGGVNLGSETFDVRPIPLPRYIAEVGNKPVDLKNGVKGTSLNSLRIEPEADENFKQEVPKDARFRIKSMDVIHARGTAPINRMKATNEVINLSQWRANFRPGDQIVIEIQKVTRRTYLNDEEDVTVRSEIIRVPLN